MEAFQAKHQRPITKTSSNEVIKEESQHISNDFQKVRRGGGAELREIITRLCQNASGN